MARFSIRSVNHPTSASKLIEMRAYLVPILSFYFFLFSFAEYGIIKVFQIF